MSDLNVIDLDRLYLRYGFKKKISTEDNIAVYAYHSGYFLNAAIVPLDASANAEKAKAHFDAAGYASTIHFYKNIKDAEQLLFEGFFSIDTNRHRVVDEYERFKSRLTLNMRATYSYIEGPFEIGEKEITDIGPVDYSIKALKSDRPVLLLLEAAAGYGKTCTAYELFNTLNSRQGFGLPVLAELSRNRQAKIFRYVLLDEINRLFPNLSYDLVGQEIANGRIILIVDGFDELLRGQIGDQETFEQAEPMLETIGDLLKGRANVVVTSRRTALFSGDAFENWVADHIGDFNVIRLKLQKPRVQDWIGVEREASLSGAGIPLKELSNPVILSFIRNLSDDDFRKTCSSAEEIVQFYFRSLLDREKERQQLRMEVDEQKALFISLAKQMRDEKFTAESADYLQLRLTEIHGDLLAHVRERYGISERPTTEELARKLVSHALLDRRGERQDQIGFVNDFAFGVMLADAFISDSEDVWLGDASFMDLAITASIPRSKTIKKRLLNKIGFALECSPAIPRLLGEIALAGSPCTQYKNECFSDVKIEGANFLTKSQFEDCVFVNCHFIDCIFRTSALPGASFVSCRFFNCSIENDHAESSGAVPVQYSCLAEPDQQLLDVFSPERGAEEKKEGSGDELEIDFRKAVLLHFWPSGKTHIQRSRNMIRNLYRGEENKHRAQISEAIDSLRRDGIISISGDIAELVMDRISDIRSGLGR